MEKYMSEDRLQQEVILWFSKTYTKYNKLLYSVPNGGSRSGYEAKILKSTGVKRGVSDLHLAILGGPYYIELKRPDGKGIQSKDQKEWQSLIERQGFEYVILSQLQDIKDYIIEKMEFMHKAMYDLKMCENLDIDNNCKFNCLTRCIQG